MRNNTSITIAVPGRPPIAVSHAMLDFTGTLSCEGALLPGVAERVRRLSKHVTITVATADTFGKAREP